MFTSGEAGTLTKHRAQVLYDGLCPFCLKSVALLRRLDWLHRLCFVDARQPEAVSVGPELDAGRLLEEMHLVAPDRYHVWCGFDALRWMAWRLPPLWLMAPFLYIPGVPSIGRLLYLWVARHRFELVPCHGGVCAPYQKSSHDPGEKRGHG